MNISQKSAAINKIDRGLFLLLHVAALHSPQAGSLSAACLPRVKQVFRAWQTSKVCGAARPRFAAPGGQSWPCAATRHPLSARPRRPLARRSQPPGRFIARRLAAARASLRLVSLALAPSGVGALCVLRTRPVPPSLRPSCVGVPSLRSPTGGAKRFSPFGRKAFPSISAPPVGEIPRAAARGYLSTYISINVKISKLSKLSTTPPPLLLGGGRESGS